MVWEKTERKLHSCLKGGNALLEETSYGRSCIGGLHVFRMAYLTICCVLLCFAERCVTGGQVFLEGMYYRRACFTVLHFEMPYILSGVCLIKSHDYMRAYACLTCIIETHRFKLGYV